MTRVASESKGLERSSARSSKSTKKTDSARSLKSSATKSEKRGKYAAGKGGHNNRCEGGRKAPEKDSEKRLVGDGDAVEIHGGKYGEIEEKEKSFHRHFALETPLQQVGRL